jgi:uncharacterized spore protein YtfJ
MMSDEQQHEHEEQPSGLPAMDNILQRLIGAASADVVFGAPVQQDSTTVIPCADISVGMGFGFGGGSGSDGGDASSGGSEGGGGGGGVRSRPVAAIVLASGGARVEPIIDVTRVGLAGLTTLAFIVAWLVRLLRATDQKGPSLQELRRTIQE